MPELSIEQLSTSLPSTPSSTPSPSSPARTALAEDTLRRLVARRRDYEQILIQSKVQDVGRHLDDLDTRLENALVDTVATTEVFTGERLRLIAPTLTDNDIFTWIKREKSWQKHGLALSDAGQPWTLLHGYVEVRNAVQHGLGRLTDFQLASKRREDVLRSIRLTGCQVDGDQIRLIRQDVDACFTTCITFIAWLDTKSPTTPP